LLNFWIITHYSPFILFFGTNSFNFNIISEPKSIFSASRKEVKEKEKKKKKKERNQYRRRQRNGTYYLMKVQELQERLLFG